MSSRWLQIVLGILIAALVAVIVIALLGGGDDKVSLTPGEPQIVSVSQLEGFADDAEHPVYWVGERDETEYELTETDNGRIFVRYLPEGGAENTAKALTVASYPLKEAAAALERTAGEGGGEQIAKSDDGAVVLLDPNSPNNVHMAYPGENTQIEVFSPVAGEALRLSKTRVQQVP